MAEDRTTKSWLVVVVNPSLLMAQHCVHETLEYVNACRSLRKIVDEVRLVITNTPGMASGDVLSTADTVSLQTDCRKLEMVNNIIHLC